MPTISIPTIAHPSVEQPAASISAISGQISAGLTGLTTGLAATVATAATLAAATRQTLVATPALMYTISAGSAWSLHALGSAGLSSLGGALFARAVSGSAAASADGQACRAEASEAAAAAEALPVRASSAPAVKASPVQEGSGGIGGAAGAAVRAEGELQTVTAEPVADEAAQAIGSVSATPPVPFVCSDAAARVPVHMDPPISSYPAVAQLGGLVVVPEAGGEAGHMRTWRVYLVSTVHVGGWFVGTTDASVNERQAAMLGKLCRHVERCAGANADAEIDAAMNASDLGAPISAVLAPHGLAGHLTALLHAGYAHPVTMPAGRIRCFCCCIVNGCIQLWALRYQTIADLRYLSEEESIPGVTGEARRRLLHAARLAHRLCGRKEMAQRREGEVTIQSLVRDSLGLAP